MAVIRALSGGGGQSKTDSIASVTNNQKITCGFKPRHIFVLCKYSGSNLMGFIYNADYNENKYLQYAASIVERDVGGNFYGFKSIDIDGFTINTNGNTLTDFYYMAMD